MRIPFGNRLIDPSFARFQASFYDVDEKRCWDGVDLSSVPLPVLLRIVPFEDAFLMYSTCGAFAGAAISILSALVRGLPFPTEFPTWFVAAGAALGIAVCISLRLCARCWYLFPCEREAVARNSRDKISAERARREEDRMRKVNNLYRKATARRRDPHGTP